MLRPDTHCPIFHVLAVGFGGSRATDAQLQKLKSADALRLKKVFGRQNACEEQHVRDVNTAAGLKAAVVDANSRMVAAQVREQRQRAAKTTDSVNDAGNDGGGVHDTVHVYNRTAWYVQVLVHI